MMPVCCSRPEAGPPNMKIAAARIEAAAGQPARQPSAPTASPPAAKVRVDDEIEGADRRCRIEQRPQHERQARRSAIADRRRWDARRSDTGFQNGAWPRVDGGREEAEEGIELVLGVPRHDRVGRRSSGWRRAARSQRWRAGPARGRGAGSLHSRAGAGCRLSGAVSSTRAPSGKPTGAVAGPLPARFLTPGAMLGGWATSVSMAELSAWPSDPPIAV